jgi:L-cysteate sulfo-lyase
VNVFSLFDFHLEIFPMQLAQFPRIRFAHLPTPLEPLDNLTKSLGGPNLYIKRDDCTGLAIGGNKTRKLEFLVADAISQGADTIVTTGGIQSNHVRQTAAAAAKAGLKCELVLARTVAWGADEYETTGNIQLDRLLGANVHIFPGDEDRLAAMDIIAGRVKSRGGKAYVVPSGGSTAVGALGYVDCAMELARQADDQGIRIDCLVHATGSAGTQGGLVAGMHAINSQIKVIGIDIDAEPDYVEKHVKRLAGETCSKMGINAPDDSTIIVESGYAGQAYGVPTEGMVAAVERLAREEGILLDPVYTGKAMAGLIDMVEKGRFDKVDNVVFLHTGGSPGLFAYRDAFEK